MRNRKQTADTYGTLAKYVPAGSLQAMNVYIHLPGKESNLFLEPASNAVEHVSVAQHLKRFGRMFMGVEDPPNCNLIRKQYHTKLLRMSREDEAMKLMEKVDAHSAHIAKKVGLVLTSCGGC